MKNLHHHIFSDTTCVSKETMLKHINKQLSKEELHAVETHLLDCEFCTDAFEGMAYTNNASMLFVIDNQIDKKVKKSTPKTPVFRNLMVAASVASIIFGTYFTFIFFNNTLHQKNHIALNKPSELNPPAAGKEQQEQLEAIMRNSTRGANTETITTKGEAKESPTNPPQIVVSKQLQKKSDNNTNKMLTDENEDKEALEEVMVMVLEDDVMEEFSEPISARSYDAPKSIERVKDEVSPLSSTAETPASKHKKRLATKVETTAIANNIETTSQKNVTTIHSKTLTIESYKVVNYLNEFQAAYDRKKELSAVSKSVAANYANQLDKKTDQETNEGVEVEVTYKKVLENAIHLYKKQDYKNAIKTFGTITAKHPQEVNAQFYSGLSYYHLEQNKAAIKKFDAVLKNKEVEFDEEANWYKALTLLKMQKTLAAKKLLKTIGAKDGFYKTQAEVKLKELR